MLVAFDDQGLSSALRNMYRDNFPCEMSGSLRRECRLLARQRKAVLGGTLDTELGRERLGRLWHRIDAVARLHFRVYETPADRRVIQRIAAAEGGIRLWHHVGRATHAFDTARQHQTCLARHDDAGRRTDGVEPRAAQAIDGGAGHFHRQSRKQGRHSGDIAVVFAGLVRATEDDVAKRRPVHFRITQHQGLDRQGRQVIGADAGQCAAIAPEWRPYGIADERVYHL